MRSPRELDAARCARALATVALGLLLASCVLAVSPDTYGEHCRFAAETTPCGACLRERCEAAIDACCGDATCGAMPDVDRCSRGEADACEALAARASSSDVRERDAGACMTARCAAVCRTFAGTSATTCSEPAGGRGATCSCKVASGAANDFDCSPSTFVGTVCCAPLSWPADGQECTCQPLGCSATPEGCFCQLSFTPPESQSCQADKCCQSDDSDQCACRGRCFEREHEVPRCAALPLETGAGCRAGQKRVESCSIRN
ncbi:MAG: hypothetical protein KF819_17480 [Labilithrix sp.]|nr:hypothetical protein [Labilithrix sp.]